MRLKATAFQPNCGFCGELDAETSTKYSLSPQPYQDDDFPGPVAVEHLANELNLHA